MPYFICPNCKNRSLDHDGRHGLLEQAAACERCGFGFLFELLDDYYPAPSVGFVVCDKSRRVLALGRGVFELTGYREGDVLGLEFEDGEDPVSTALEWGVRQLDKPVVVHAEGDLPASAVADLFPAYDEDGGLLVILTPQKARQA